MSNPFFYIKIREKITIIAEKYNIFYKNEVILIVNF